jgi:hypothetical protein
MVNEPLQTERRRLILIVAERKSRSPKSIVQMGVAKAALVSGKERKTGSPSLLVLNEATCSATMPQRYATLQ